MALPHVLTGERPSFLVALGCYLGVGVVLAFLDGDLVPTVNVSRRRRVSVTNR